MLRCGIADIFLLEIPFDALGLFLDAAHRANSGAAHSYLVSGRSSFGYVLLQIGAIGIGQHNRSLAIWRIATAAHVVRAQAGLVSPQNLSALCFAAFAICEYSSPTHFAPASGDCS